MIVCVTIIDYELNTNVYLTDALMYIDNKQVRCGAYTDRYKIVTDWWCLR